MPKYVVTTHSTFENRYLVEATDGKTAISNVLNEESNTDFYQKHLGEEAFTAVKVVDNYQMHEISNILGYF